MHYAAFIITYQKTEVLNNTIQKLLEQSGIPRNKSFVNLWNILNGTTRKVPSLLNGIAIIVSYTL